MPSDASILGFGNRWYDDVLATAMRVDLDGVAVRAATAPAFLATKLIALADRGAGDYRASHDLEDILAVVDGRALVRAELDAAPVALRT